MKIMRTPRFVELAITHRCNLRCKYCSYFTSGADSGQDLPGEEWLRFFEELNRCAVMKVTLQGGEPFCREDLDVLIQGIVSNRMRFDILSNGTLITKEMAAFLASTGRCDDVQVSIDGSVPITHDSFRGEGNFTKAIRGIEWLVEQGINVSVRVTIHRQNVRDLHGIARLLLEEIGLPGFSTNAASYMGLCRQNSALVQLTTEERSLAMDVLLELSKKYPGRISATAGPLAEATSWVEMEMARRKGMSRLDGGAYLSACGGPMNTIAVRADGVMIPCIQLSHIELGHVNADRLEEVWQHHPALKRLRERGSIPLSAFSYCEGCNYIGYCTGNCPALAYLIVGDENHPSPDACLKRFLEDGGKLPGLALGEIC